MLFMGSEKFPDENDYDAYLASSGGASNAYTELVRRLLKVCMERDMQASCLCAFCEDELAGKMCI
jgi:nardilysin